jgi:tetratricopeptide (TPR) repeat protein
MHHRCTIALLARLTLGLSTGALVLAATPAAHAQDKVDKRTRDKARKEFGDGQKAYEAGDFKKAQKHFMKANELIPAPQAEYWIAMSIYKQGNKDDAKKALEAFLAKEDASKVGDEKLSEAKNALKELVAADATEVKVATEPSGASVIIDGEAQMGETPMALKLTPGKHQLVVSAPSYESKVVDFEVKAGEPSEQKVQLVPKEAEVAPTPPPAETPAPTPPPEPPPKAESKLPAYITLGVAAVGAGVGTFFGIQALSAKSDFDKHPSESLADDAERDALIADMAFGVAVTLGVTGVVLLTSGGEEAEKPVATTKRSRWAVAPYVSPRGGGAAARLSF